MTERPLEIFLFKACTSSQCEASYSFILNRIGEISHEVVTCVPDMKGLELNCVIADGRSVRGLNKRFRNEDRATDVLSFPLEGNVDGEVWLCPSVIEKNAQKFNQTFEAELLRVFIHGMLHLGGFDHKNSFTSHGKQKERMFVLQERILHNLLGEDE